MRAIQIGVTDTITNEDKFNRYVQWIDNSGAKYLRLSYKSDNGKEIQKCDGLLLTGGGDVDPILYGSRWYRKLQNVDRRRDDFERKLIDKAMEMNIPILAICRGMQLVNVHFGGTLFEDVEEAGFRPHAIHNDENYHQISVSKDSHLKSIVNEITGMVNSFHHQAVDKVGTGLKAVAHSDDNVIEALEIDNKSNCPLFILVQWHPERMERKNPFSLNILKNFLEESYKHSNNLKGIKDNL